MTPKAAPQDTAHDTALPRMPRSLRKRVFDTSTSSAAQRSVRAELELSVILRLVEVPDLKLARSQARRRLAMVTPAIARAARAATMPSALAPFRAVTAARPQATAAP